MQKKINFFTLISFLALISSLILPNVSLGSQGSSIVITRTPYLSFNDLPDPFSFNTYTVSGSDGGVFSDPLINLGEGSGLPTSRNITVTDTRNSGGFDLQVSATDFANMNGSISKNNLRIVSSTGFNAAPDAANLKVIYQDGFAGENSINTPVDAGTNTNFGSAATFISGSYSSANSFSGNVELMNGCLSSSQGRNGQMSLGVSFYLAIPKFTVPGTYNSTVTYTLIDDTSESC